MRSKILLDAVEESIETGETPPLTPKGLVYTVTDSTPGGPSTPPKKGFDRPIDELTLDHYRKAIERMFDSYRLLPWSV